MTEMAFPAHLWQPGTTQWGISGLCDALKKLRNIGSLGNCYSPVALNTESIYRLRFEVRVSPFKHTLRDRLHTKTFSK